MITSLFILLLNFINQNSNIMKKHLLRIFLFAMLCIITQSNSCYPDHVTGCECETEDIIRGSKIVSSSSTSASFSVYGVTGENRADAACHANMKLTFRWVSDQRAKTFEKPNISYEFQTIFGYFPTNENMELLNIDGNGIHTWTISISEAADKSTPEGISYGIQVNYIGEPSNGDAVNCDMEITYRIFNEYAYSDGCDID